MRNSVREPTYQPDSEFEVAILLQLSARLEFSEFGARNRPQTLLHPRDFQPESIWARLKEYSSAALVTRQT